MLVPAGLDPPIFPEPVIKPAANQFLIQLPTVAATTVGLKEWDLELQKSTDNSSWDDWKLVKTVPASQPVYVYQYADLIIPYYYRFRYKLRTAGVESDYSEAGYAGLARTVVLGSDIEGEIDPVENLPFGGITSDLIQTNAITANLISAAAIHAVHIAANEINASHIESDSIIARHIKTDAIETRHLSADVVTSAEIIANAITSDHIQTNAINNLHIGDNSIDGVKLEDGSVTALQIEAETITADKLATGFLDANVSRSAYIEAESIRGGELALGGTAVYTANFCGNDRELLHPWELGGTTTGKYTEACSNQKLEINLLSSTAYSAGDSAKFMYARPNSTNRISNIKFHLKVDLPADFIMELVDQNGSVINSFTKTGTYETATAGTLDMETQTPSPYAAQVGFQVRCTSNTTTGAGITKFIQLTNVEFEFEKGYGNISVYDASSRLRAEVRSDYIGFNKAIGATANRAVTITEDRTFLADEEGVWVPADGLTIGTSTISDLRYLLRDLSGNLCINPRFESLKNITQGSSLSQVPTDWTYLDTTTRGEDYIGFKDVLPQRQSLVSGRVLTMNLQSGWTNTRKLYAVSHKRYVDQDTNTPQMPFAMSSYFRVTPNTASTADKDKVKVRMELYASSSPLDITSTTDVSGDISLGYVELTGSAVSDVTIDGNVLFQRLAHSYRLATTTNEMILAADGKYIYVVLSAWAHTGTLTNNTLVEWDNVDLAIAEENTPSDSQPDAEMTRRVGDLNLLITYAFSGTKCILPELSTGAKGLGMTAVW